MTSRDLQALEEQGEKKALKRLSDAALNRVVESENEARKVRYGSEAEQAAAALEQEHAIVVAEEFGLIGKEC